MPGVDPWSQSNPAGTAGLVGRGTISWPCKRIKYGRQLRETPVTAPPLSPLHQISLGLAVSLDTMVFRSAFSLLTLVAVASTSPAADIQELQARAPAPDNIVYVTDANNFW